MMSSIAFSLKELVKKYSPAQVSVELVGFSENSRIPSDVRVKFEKAPCAFLPKQTPWVVDEVALLGKLPQTHYDHEVLSSSWTIVRSTVDSRQETPAFELGSMPAMGLPIIVNYEGRKQAAVGFMALHDIGDGRTEYVFMEQSDDEHFPIYAMVPTARSTEDLENGKTEMLRYIPQIADGIIGWNYLSIDGAVLIDKTQNEELELFADCEFETETSKLISVGLVNTVGTAYYAYDKNVAKEVKDPWVRENVIPHLTSVPAATTVVELSDVGLSFYEWLAGVIAIEQEATKSKNVNIRIRVDYSTDVVYIAQLFHRLNQDGIERFGNARRVSFQIDYVDSYPSQLRSAVRHNAAWDAVALWHHLGYYKKRILRNIMNSANLADVLETLYKKSTENLNSN